MSHWIHVARQVHLFTRSSLAGTSPETCIVFQWQLKSKNPQNDEKKNVDLCLIFLVAEKQQMKEKRNLHNL